METKFGDGTEINPYLATAYTEGFCEGEGASAKDQIRAWSYLIGTNLAYSLQGSFGRAATGLIENGYIEPSGKVNWSEVNKSLMETNT